MSAGLTTCHLCDWERWAPTSAYAIRIKAEHLKRDHKTTPDQGASE